MTASKNSRRPKSRARRRLFDDAASIAEVTNAIAGMATDAVDNSPDQARPRGRPARTGPAPVTFSMRLDQAHLDALERIDPSGNRTQAIRTAIERADATPAAPAQDPGQPILFGDDAMDLLHAIQADVDRIIARLFSAQQDGYVKDQEAPPLAGA